MPTRVRCVVTVVVVVVGSAGMVNPALAQSNSQQACSNPTQTSSPQAAALRNDVGCTTVVSDQLEYNHEQSETVGGTIASNSHIYGPFDAGFMEPQNDIITAWGCSDPSVAHGNGGYDLAYETNKVASVCGINFPRIESSTSEYYGIVGACGGHTGDYHFHGGFECFETNSGTHSKKVGVAGNANVYGRWEDYTANKYPYLDACGGHFGFTPESPSTAVYHYHIQRDPPFTIGCYGPSSSNGLVTVSDCRALYPECSGTVATETWGGQTHTYMKDCPCFDANGLNYGTITEVPAIAKYALSPSVISYDASTWTCKTNCIPLLSETTVESGGGSSSLSTGAIVGIVIGSSFAGVFITICAHRNYAKRLDRIRRVMAENAGAPQRPQGAPTTARGYDKVLKKVRRQNEKISEKIRRARQRAEREAQGEQV